MKAWQIVQPGAMQQVELPQPTVDRGEVLLRVQRIGYCGSDLNTYRGYNPLVSYPRVPGHEIAGLIECVGGDVPPAWRPGLAVTVLPYTTCGRCASCRSGRTNACQNNQTLGVQRDGALQPWLVVPWNKLLTAPGLSLAELALVEPLSVGFHAAQRGRVQAGDIVCVLGSGMIGLGVIAAAGLDRGATVIAVDVDDQKLALAKQAGATHTINSSREDLHQRLAALTDGHGPHVVVEAIGLPQTFVAAVNEVAYAGRVVYIGYAKQDVSYATKQFILKELDIMGSRNATAEDFQRVMRLLESGRFPVAGTITRTVAMADAGQAMADWAANPAAVTKIQVEVG